ncbi:peptidylprolyl isomerase [Flavobacterium sp. CS20]|jgi:peptidylprolyl isomerase|uniref:peptidylprolyl isomerase n=1 Tax=Flavobacterium sp. CS20 TaxID=2775246 RepID=UPI001B3A1AD5|nr:peptidylprolyl isomerase [Flavobacterium sp. CS20]QTY26869.1 peptidylprolyl isomerase [Flavobacterium sp. CS20]
MKTLFKLFLLTLIISSMSCQNEYSNLDDGLYAKFDTNYGEFIAKLYHKKAPMTVGNFVSLAEGNNPKAKEKYQGKKFFDSLTFHRVIDGFMIQGGDPLGTGQGDPGYKFPNEITELTHDTIGVLSMANSGPNTNGSQFFITLKPQSPLNGSYSVFGQIVEGQSVVDSIGKVETDTRNKPKEAVRINTVEIIRKGQDAKNFDAAKAFENGIAEFEEAQAKKQEEINNTINSMYDNLQETESGLRYVITKENPSGEQPQVGDNVSVHYEGRLIDGTVFDSSFKRDKPITFPLGQRRVIAGWDEGIALMKKGEKATLVIPPDLGYGPRGAGGVIPPNAYLIFDVELVDIK